MIHLPHRRKAFRGSGFGAAFSPTDIDSLEIWLDASVGVEEAASDSAEDGDTVAGWLDQSGNNNDPSVYSATFRTSPSRVEFADSYGRLDWGATSPAGSSAATVFVVLDSVDTIGAWFTSSTLSYTFPYVQSGSSFSGNGGNVGTPSFYSSGVLVSPTTRGNFYTQYHTGNVELATVTNLDLSTWTNFNFRSPEWQWKWYGDIYEIIAYSANLSSEDRGLVENYLITKHGIS